MAETPEQKTKKFNTLWLLLGVVEALAASAAIGVSVPAIYHESLMWDSIGTPLAGVGLILGILAVYHITTQLRRIPLSKPVFAGLDKANG